MAEVPYLQAVNPFRHRSPREWRTLRQAVLDFRDPYAAYIERTLPDVYADKPPVFDSERRRLVQLSTAADEAVEAAGVHIAISAPLAFQPAPVLSGIAPLAFAHENKLYRGVSPVGARYTPPYEMVLDALDQADAILHRRELASRKLVSRLDRWLRLVLGFPSYLVSLIVGFDRRRLSDAQARALWWLSVVADIASVYGLGVLIGWW